jgi:MFS family permease
MPLMALASSLIGAELAPSPNWATAPIALMICGTAIAVIPVTQLMRKIGRKIALFWFMLVGILGCLIAIAALQLASFALFCFASFILGALSASLMQGRFAAMESVSPDNHARAASIVMGGGIIAAYIGPELAILGRQMSTVDYQGSFALAIACIGMSALVLSLYKPASQTLMTATQTQTPTMTLLSNPSFFLALSSGAIAYVIMSFVMTGTPISMHHFHDHSLLDTKWVIQSHIAAMFLPSFITPFLFRHLGIRGMMLIGLLCYCATIGIGFLNTSVTSFWWQLILLGIGWNFLFIGGTTLLPSTHPKQDRFKAQGINDFTVFSCQAIAALSAGWALNLLSWQQILIGCLLPVTIMLGLLIWERSRTTNAKIGR